MLSLETEVMGGHELTNPRDRGKRLKRVREGREAMGEVGL
jgi:hypothetical protein